MSVSPERNSASGSRAANLIVGDAEGMPVGTVVVFDHEGRSYVLVRLNDEVRCFDGSCPHQRGKLTDVSPAGDVVTCSRHGCLRWRFDTGTGICLQHPRMRAQTYPAWIDEGKVVVDLRRPTRVLPHAGFRS